MDSLSGRVCVSLVLATAGCAGGRDGDRSLRRRARAAASVRAESPAREAHGLVRDPDRFENEVGLGIYDVSDLRVAGTDVDVGDAIASVVRLCAHGDREQIVDERGGKLVVLAGRRTHGIVASILGEMRTHPEDGVWKTGPEWRGPLERAVSGADAVAIRHRALVVRITDPAEVEAFIRRLRFRDSYSGTDYEIKLGPRIDFLRDGELLAGIEYVTYDGGARLRWERGPWRGCATLTEESCAYLLELLKRKGIVDAVHAGFRERLFPAERP
ncbi:MAG: hypothetical protein ACYS9X_14960 [Planctomycetota bacterium]|jgi:hypothetical protein